MPRLALVGDFSPDVLAHRAIPRALEFAQAETSRPVSWEWIHTSELGASVADAARVLETLAGVWLVPASPYANTPGALAAVQFARETRRPFLGTCGGFQHMLIELARHVAGLPTADHAETNPGADTLVVTPLACSLVEKSGAIHLGPDSILRESYGHAEAHEGYHCSYGLNTLHRAALARAGLRFTAFDAAGDVRAAELPRARHPFFVGTLFQPERAALRGETPPLVRTFLRALW